jgi:uncharacterized membrane protein
MEERNRDRNNNLHKKFLYFFSFVYIIIYFFWKEAYERIKKLKLNITAKKVIWAQRNTANIVYRRSIAII